MSSTRHSDVQQVPAIIIDGECVEVTIDNHDVIELKPFRLSDVGHFDPGLEGEVMIPDSAEIQNFGSCQRLVRLVGLPVFGGKHSDARVGLSHL